MFTFIRKIFIYYTVFSILSVILGICPCNNPIYNHLQERIKDQKAALTIAAQQDNFLGKASSILLTLFSGNKSEQPVKKSSSNNQTKHDSVESLDRQIDDIINNPGKHTEPTCIKNDLLIMLENFGKDTSNLPIDPCGENLRQQSIDKALEDF